MPSVVHLGLKEVKRKMKKMKNDRIAEDRTYVFGIYVDNDKTFHFVYKNGNYFINEIGENEVQLYQTKDSKQAYRQWNSMKRPDKRANRKQAMSNPENVFEK